MAAAGVACTQRLAISGNCPLILDYHVALDKAREAAELGAAEAEVNGHDLGRELFGGMRRSVRSAEEGAVTWL